MSRRGQGNAVANALEGHPRSRRCERYRARACDDRRDMPAGGVRPRASRSSVVVGHGEQSRIAGQQRLPSKERLEFEAESPQWPGPLRDVQPQMKRPHPRHSFESRVCRDAGRRTCFGVVQRIGLRPAHSQAFAKLWRGCALPALRGKAHDRRRSRALRWLSTPAAPLRTRRAQKNSGRSTSVSK